MCNEIELIVFVPRTFAHSSLNERKCGVRIVVCLFTFGTRSKIRPLTKTNPKVGTLLHCPLAWLGLASIAAENLDSFLLRIHTFTQSSGLHFITILSPFYVLSDLLAVQVPNYKIMSLNTTTSMGLQGSEGTIGLTARLFFTAAVILFAVRV